MCHKRLAWLLRHETVLTEGEIMKVSFRVLVLFLGMAGVGTSDSFGQSGWFWQNPLPQGNNLLGAATPGPSTVVAVGTSGTILRSSDGGETWTPQTSGTNRDLLAVSFVDGNTGTAVGEGGTIVRTTDGGETWTRQTSGTTNFLRAVSFVDANTGTAVGDQGIILHTTDGGDTWTRHNGALPNLQGVSFPRRSKQRRPAAVGH